MHVEVPEGELMESLPVILDFKFRWQRLPLTLDL